jgi:hypothetical protein
MLNYSVSHFGLQSGHRQSESPFAAVLRREAEASLYPTATNGNDKCKGNDKDKDKDKDKMPGLSGARFTIRQ